MKKNFKKLIWLGTIASIATPVAAVVSCGQTSVAGSAASNSEVLALNKLDLTSQNAQPIVEGSSIKVGDALAKLPGFKSQPTDLMIKGSPTTSSTVADGKDLKANKDDADLFKSTDSYSDYSELAWLKHFASLNTTSPSGVSPMYRWKQSVSISQIKEVVDKTLGNLIVQFINAQKTKDVETPTNPFGSSKYLFWDKTTNAWSADIEKIKDGSYDYEDHAQAPKSFIGNIKDIIIGNRAKSGIVKSLIIVGSKNTIAVASEYQIRFLLRFKQVGSYGIAKENWKSWNKLNVAAGKITTYAPDLKDKAKVDWKEKYAKDSREAKYNSGYATLFKPIPGVEQIGRTIPSNGYTSGYALLPSGYFSIYRKGDILTFFGGGYGHGVGMSQYGAAQLGRAGWTPTDIVNHYYTGGTVKNVKDSDDFTKAKQYATIGLTFGAAQSDARKVSTTQLTLSPAKKGAHLSFKATKTSTSVEFKADETVAVKRVGNNFEIVGDKGTAKQIISAVNIANTSEGNTKIRDDANLWGFKSSDGRIGVQELKNSKKWRKYKIVNGVPVIVKADDGKTPIAYAPEYAGWIMPFVSKQNSAKSSFTVANKTIVTNYIKYVLPSEMPAYFGAAALAAQAITARSNFYAEVKSDSKGGYGVDVLDSTASQVYNQRGMVPAVVGKLDEESLFEAASKADVDMIIATKDGNNVLQTVYASANSGLSAAPEDAWTNWAIEPPKLNTWREYKTS